MGFNMQKLMKQAQKMQQDVAKAQEELQGARVEGQSGGGMVRVVASGQQDILSISIAPEVIDPDDVEMLEDLVLAAIRDALQNSRELMADRMSQATGGMNMGNLPGGFL